MSKEQTFLKERLPAADAATAGHTEEKQRKQLLPDTALSPRIVLVRGNARSPSIKEEPEEHSIRPVAEQQPLSVQDVTAVCVKEEESSPLQQRQIEHREETQGEDFSSEPHFDSDADKQTDDDDWGPPFSFSAPWTEAKGDHNIQVQTRKRNVSAQNSGLSPKNKSAPETTTVNNGDTSTNDEDPEYNSQSHLRARTVEKPYTCSVCEKTFNQRINRDRHMRIHTGDKPFSCAFCRKSFNQRIHRDTHIRIHTGEKPYSCSICEKTFTRKGNRDEHMSIHTGQKPYSCLLCVKTFKRKIRRDEHMTTHTGEKPYSCTICHQTFTQKSNRDTHMRTHTGEKPYSCAVCTKTFSQKRNRDDHMRSHTGEELYSCSVCKKTFTHKFTLKKHLKSKTHKEQEP